jgi:hypothetical protein
MGLEIQFNNKNKNKKRHLKYDTNYKQYENRSTRLGPSSGTANTDEGQSLVRKFAQYMPSFHIDQTLPVHTELEIIK